MARAVLTRGYDNSRSGANVEEDKLTVNAVATTGLRRLFSLTMAGDARGLESQPLIVPDVELEDGSRREVVYCCTMANDIYAFDAADGQQQWVRRLGTPVTDKTIDAWHHINDHWGVLGTPVIDAARSAMYLIAWTSPDGSLNRSRYSLYAINIKNGRNVEDPLDLEGVTFEPGNGLPALVFKSSAMRQRPALLLAKAGGTTMVFAAFGPAKELDPDVRGWVIACRTAPLKFSAAWTSTARGSRGGIWQAGAGPAADEQGDVYLMTGNGDFDGITDFGESFVKLRYSDGGEGTEPSLTAVDWWTPWTDRDRDPEHGQSNVQPGESLPVNVRFRGYFHSSDTPVGPEPPAGAVFPTGGWFDPEDMDLGSGGPVIASNANALLGAGKDGILYVLKKENLGKTSKGDLATPDKNYGKLKFPPLFFTYFPGFDVNPAPEDITALNGYWNNLSHHQHGSPIYWNSGDPDVGGRLYCWGENGNLRAWLIADDGTVTYKACSSEVASEQAGCPPGGSIPPGGMPGGMLTLSANGAEPGTAIIWATIPYWDANIIVGPGRLLAYDATQFNKNSDGSLSMRLLWDSQTANLPFIFNKFTSPVVANGRVYVSTYDGRVDVYGLA